MTERSESKWRLLVATTNAGKLREIRALLSGAPIELTTLHDLDPIEEPEETGATFEENARLKALYYASRSGLTTVAEDSGLVIDGMDGEPGVRSARFIQTGRVVSGAVRGDLPAAGRTACEEPGSAIRLRTGRCRRRIGSSTRRAARWKARLRTRPGETAGSGTTRSSTTLPTTRRSPR